VTGADPRGSINVVLLDPAGLLEHPRNVRAELGDLTGLTASIAAQGVIEPITVVPLPDGGHQVVAGHRRRAAAIAAGLDEVPCVVRGDLAAGVDDNAGQAAHVGAMLAENLHREGLTATEEARGVQAMLDLGVPISKVAKGTGLDAKRVKKAIGVARLDEGTAAMVDDFGMTLDQAAVVALYADAPETTAKLAAAAKEGPGRFAHAVQRAKEEAAAERAYAEKLAELQTAGVTLTEDVNYGGRKNRRVLELSHDGEPLTETSHADCPGRAVYLSQNWNGPYTVEVCTDYAAHGHTDRYGSSSTSSKPETEEGKAAATAERRRVIENNKAMAAANAVRRAWVKEFLARRSAPKDILRFAVEQIAASHGVLRTWLSSESSNGDEDAAEQLGLESPVRPWSMSAASAAERPTTMTNGEHVPDARLPLQLLAHLAGAIETSIAKDSWRKGYHRRDELVRWLTFLAGHGYTLSDVEQQVVDGAPK
jgi:ParB family chromosome partitioning protein